MGKKYTTGNIGRNVSSFIYVLGISVTLLFICSCRQSSSFEYTHAVSTASPEASEIGMQILKRGGNAADAVIAITFALNVTEPAMSGIGGGTQIQMRLPNKMPFAINGSTLSPAATPTQFLKDSLKTYLRTTIPSTVRVMQYLYENYASGNLSWADLITPSIQLIEEGFSRGNFRTKVMDKYREKLWSHPSVQSYLFDSDTFDLDKLSWALQTLADEGPETFYSGSIGEAIHRDMEHNNGWITLDDLKNFPLPEEVPSVHFTYYGYDVYTQPEPCGGWVVKEILEELKEMRKEESNSIKALVHAIHYGHQIRKMKAEEQVNYSGETTHFSVMDNQGMCLSVTASINAYYGAGVANTEYGFLYNSYMDDFNFQDEENKYAVGPGKMAYSSMSPTIVMKDNKVALIIGSPGSARIISTVAQLTDKYIMNTCEPSDLVSKPRIHAQNKQVYFESGNIKKEFQLKDSTWQIIDPRNDLGRNNLNPYFGGVHAIIWTGKDYLALADPRRDGLALID